MRIITGNIYKRQEEVRLLGTLRKLKNSDLVVRLNVGIDVNTKGSEFPPLQGKG